MRTVTAVVSDEVAEALTQEAENQDRTRSAHVGRILREYVESKQSAGSIHTPPRSGVEANPA